MGIPPSRSPLFVPVCLLLAFGLLVVGCDSGGSNGSSEPELNGDITVRLESSGSSNANAKVSGILTAQFYRTRNGSSCDNTDGRSVNKIPADVTLSPDTDVCDNPSDYDRVTVSFSGSASGLTMTVLDGNGNEIGTDASPSDGLNVDSGELPDSGNDDGSNGSAETAKWKGNWKVKKAFSPYDTGTQGGYDLSNVEYAYSFTVDNFTLVQSPKSVNQCFSSPAKIQTVNGNTIDLDDQTTGAIGKARLEVFNEGKSLNLYEVNDDGSEAKVTKSESVDKTPKEILGCSSVTEL